MSESENSSSSYMKKRNAGHNAGKHELPAETIKGPWVEKDYAAEYDRDQLSWDKVRALNAREVVSHTSSVVREKGARLNEIYFRGWHPLQFFFPILRWLPTYDWKLNLWNDIIAGFAIACMVVPQGMSYASSLAFLPKEYGLYTAFTPCLLYGIFGTSRQLQLGPVAVVSTLLGKNLESVMPPLWSDPSFGWNEKTGKKAKYKKPWNYAVHPKYNATKCVPLFAKGLEHITESDLQDKKYVGCRFKIYDEVQNLYNKLAVQTALLVGLLQFLLGFFRFGFLINFLSHSVISGFTTGAAFIIGLGQFGDLLGFKLKKKDYVHQSLYYIVHGLSSTNWHEFLMSFVWLALLIAFKEVGKRSRRLQFFRVLGPLTVCILGILVTVIGNRTHHDSNWAAAHYNVVGIVPKGMPPVTVHELSIGAASKLWKAVLAVASVDLMESIALGKAMARKNGYRIESNDEYRGLGIMNIIASFFSAYPATGSFSRSSVNNSMGAKSPIATFTTGLFVMFTLLFITPVFKYLPKNALAAIIISGVLGLMDFPEAKALFRISKKDFAIWLVCWVCTMFLGVDIGLAISVGLALLIVIYESAFPHTAVLGRIPGTSVYRNIEQYPDAESAEGLLLVRIDAPLYFANTVFVREKLEDYLDAATGTNRFARGGKKREAGNGKSKQQQLSEVQVIDSSELQLGAKDAESQGSKSSDGASSSSSDATGLTVVNPGKGTVQYLILDFTPVTRVDVTSLHMLEELHEDLQKRGIQLVVVNPTHLVMESFDLAGFTNTLGRENIFVRMHDAVKAVALNTVA